MKKRLVVPWMYLVLLLLLVGGASWQQRQQGQKPPENPRRGGGLVTRNPDQQKSLKQHVKNFRTPHSKRVIPRSFFVNRAILDSLLAQPNCHGVRLYLAVEKVPAPAVRDTAHLVLVGVDKATNQDQTDPDKAAPLTPTFMMGYTLDRCPANCRYETSDR